MSFIKVIKNSLKIWWKEVIEVLEDQKGWDRNVKDQWYMELV
jgi:hypothetical protein